MIEPPIHLWRDALEARFGTGRRFVVYRETASTQDAARRLLAGSPPQPLRGAVVVADVQTHGRGRLGRRWVAPPGANRALTFSYVQPLRSATVDLLTFATSVAVARSVDALLRPRHHRATIKWPNDIYAGGGKVAGILIETTGDHAVVGVGLNVGSRPEDFPRELRQKAASLALCGVDIDRLSVLIGLIEEIDRALGEDEAELLRTWRDHCGMLHQPVRLAQHGQVIEGQVIDLDPREGLILRCHSGEIVHLHAATTSVLD